MKRILLFFAYFSVIARGIAVAQTIAVVPDRIMVDECARIRVSGLHAHERITIKAQLADGGGQHWISQAEFIADPQGDVDTSIQKPEKGSYKELSAMGLVWAMKPIEKGVRAYKLPSDFAPQRIEFDLYVNDSQVSQAHVEQFMIGEGVRQEKIEDELHGMLFLPNTNEPHPGVLVLGGSEGGVPSQKAAWLATHGYAALALAYFRYENLSPYLEAIPLEYFGRALNWMLKRPEIAPDKIAVVGTSRGGELALQLGSMYPQIKAVVAYVPANVRYAACCGATRLPYAWTWDGRPLAYVRPRLAHDPGAELRAEIPVEQTHGPILLISGQEDGVWQSSRMAEAVVERLKRSHFRYAIDHLNYPHAGHRAGRPEIVPAWQGMMKHPVSGREVDVGGSTSGNAQSSQDAIPKVLDFLCENLGGASCQGANLR